MLFLLSKQENKNVSVTQIIRNNFIESVNKPVILKIRKINKARPDTSSAIIKIATIEAISESIGEDVRILMLQPL